LTSLLNRGRLSLKNLVLSGKSDIASEVGNAITLSLIFKLKASTLKQTKGQPWQRAELRTKGEVERRWASDIKAFRIFPSKI
jgi:hypothetical protein